MGEKHLLNRLKPLRGLLGTKKHSGCSLPSGSTQKSVLAAGCQAQGAAVLHGRSLAPGSSPAISAAALHPLCFVRAAQVAACGQLFQHPPPTWGLCDQCKVSSLPIPPASPPVSAISSSENPHFINSVTERKGLRLVQGESWQSRNAQVHK